MSYRSGNRCSRDDAGGRSGTLHLAQAESNRARRGRKKDFADAERLMKRLVAQELTLSFVPDAEQRLWRTVTCKKYQFRCARVQLQTKWSLFWKRPISSCPASSPICWVSVPSGC